MMFAMLTVGFFMWGLIPHIVTVAILLDIITKRLPIFFLLVPIGLYGVYYNYYFQQKSSAFELEKKIVQENPKEIIEFDPLRHALVLDNARGLVSHYKILVAFEKSQNTFGENNAYRLVTKDKCKELKRIGLPSKYELKSDYLCNSSVSLPKEKRLVGERLESVALIRLPEKIINDQIEIITKDNKKESNASRKKIHIFGQNIGIDDLSLLKSVIKSYDFFYNQELVGSFKTAEAFPLSPIPSLMFGCFLSDSPADWICGINFARDKKEISGFSPDVDISAYGENTIAALLHISRYKDDELRGFVDYPENIKIINSLIQERQRETPQDFDKWGIHQDSAYSLEVGKYKGYTSLKGKIFESKNGDSFYEFMRINQGKYVYIDIDISDTYGVQDYYLRVLAKCSEDENGCNKKRGREYWFLDNKGESYILKNKDVKTIKGIFKVGEEQFREKENMDSRTDLVAVELNGISAEFK